MSKLIGMATMHHYAFSVRAGDPIPVYERTFGEIEAARRWVSENPARRFFMTKWLPPRSWY